MKSILLRLSSDVAEVARRPRWCDHRICRGKPRTYAGSSEVAELAVHLLKHDVLLADCPLNGDCFVFVSYHRDGHECPLYGIVGCPHFRGLNYTAVNGNAIRACAKRPLKRGVRISEVRISEVPLYVLI